MALDCLSIFEIVTLHLNIPQYHFDIARKHPDSLFPEVAGGHINILTSLGVNFLRPIVSTTFKLMLQHFYQRSMPQHESTPSLL
jgi:hypothetical protein